MARRGDGVIALDLLSPPAPRRRPRVRAARRPPVDTLPLLRALVTPQGRAAAVAEAEASLVEWADGFEDVGAEEI